METISEALALNIQTGDFSDQGDDLHILSTVFLAQNRFSDAEKTVQQALEMHRRSKSKYGEARDLARLGNIILQMQEGKSDAEDHSNAVLTVRQAQTPFGAMNASAESYACYKQEKLMREQDIDDDDYLDLSD